MKRCSSCQAPLSATLVQRKADRCLRCRRAQPGRPDTTGRPSATRTPPWVAQRTLGKGVSLKKRKAMPAQHIAIRPKFVRPKPAAHGSWWVEPQYQQDRAAFMAKAESLFLSEPTERMQLPEWVAS